MMNGNRLTPATPNLLERWVSSCRPGGIHSPRSHRGAYCGAVRVGADAGNQQRSRAEGMQVPGDIEGGSPQHGVAAGKVFEQDFTEDQRGGGHRGNLLG